MLQSRFLDFDDSRVSAAKLEVGASLPAVRRLVTGRRAQPTGKFFSIKNYRSVEHESRGEKLGMYFAEVRPEVIRYYPQPFRLSWRENGQFREYFPDRLEQRDSGWVAVEVKRSSDKLGNDSYLEKLDTSKQLLDTIGVGFEIETRQELEADPRNPTVQTILYHAARDIPREVLRRSVEFLLERGRSHLLELEAAMGGGDLAHSWVYGLIPRRLAEIELGTEPGPDPLIRPGRGAWTYEP